MSNPITMRFPNGRGPSEIVITVHPESGQVEVNNAERVWARRLFTYDPERIKTFHTAEDAVNGDGLAFICETSLDTMSCRLARCGLLPDWGIMEAPTVSALLIMHDGPAKIRARVEVGDKSILGRDLPLVEPPARKVA
jgi:hypothetical protein